MKILFFILFLLYTMSLWGQHQAPAPLFRDPITDGAADPVLIWNRTEKNWWMLYTHAGQIPKPQTSPIVMGIRSV